MENTNITVELIKFSNFNAALRISCPPLRTLNSSVTGYKINLKKSRGLSVWGKELESHHSVLTSMTDQIENSCTYQRGEDTGTPWRPEGWTGAQRPLRGQGQLGDPAGGSRNCWRLSV